MEKSKQAVIEISSSPSSEEKEKAENGSPITPIFCLQKIMDMKRFEETQDCFILDFDPYDSIDTGIAKLSVNCDDNLDLSVVAEKGQVACRDYPHSRHLCVKHPFDTSPHENHCELCYCYVCDSAAPCKYWLDTISPDSAHCHASENVEFWKSLRNSRKQIHI